MTVDSGKNKGGRPRSWKPTILELDQIEILSGQGFSEGDIAARLDITRGRWRQSKAKYAQIELAYVAGKEHYKELMYKHMQEMARDVNSRNHFQALKWVLEVEFGMGNGAKAMKSIEDKFDRKTGKFTEQQKPYGGYDLVPADPRTDKPQEPVEAGKDGGQE